MISNPKHVSTLPFYVDIMNGIFTNWLLKKETTKPNYMEIKYDLVLNGITCSESDEIEYNTIGTFQTSDIKTPGYYIVQ